MNLNKLKACSNFILNSFQPYPGFSTPLGIAGYVVVFSAGTKGALASISNIVILYIKIKQAFST